MLAYWLSLGFLSLPFFDNLNISSGLTQGLSTMVSYVRSFNIIFDFDTFFTMLGSFLLLFLVYLICSLVLRILGR